MFEATLACFAEARLPGSALLGALGTVAHGGAGLRFQGLEVHGKHEK